MSKNAERRRFPRYPLFVQGTAKMPANPGGQSFAIATSDISLGGMRLYCDDEMGTSLHLQNEVGIHLIDPETGTPLSYKGKVVWRRKSVWNSPVLRPDQVNILGQYTFGVEFIETDEQAIRKLHDPVSRLWGPLP